MSVGGSKASQGRGKYFGGFSRLSSLELKIIQLVAQGKGSQTIARHLHLSFNTVEAHRGNISKIFRLCGAVIGRNQPFQVRLQYD